MKDFFSAGDSFELCTVHSIQASQPNHLTVYSDFEVWIVNTPWN